LLLSLLGYVPAWLTGQGLYGLVRSGTSLPVFMDLNRSVIVFALILSMCMVSAALAMRKLVDADPAEIF
jgi:putative ABC transport system permease protein